MSGVCTRSDWAEDVSNLATGLGGHFSAASKTGGWGRQAVFHLEIIFWHQPHNRGESLKIQFDRPANLRSPVAKADQTENTKLTLCSCKYINKP